LKAKPEARRAIHDPKPPTVALMGGLGNQLFQVAAALWLKERLHTPVVLTPVDRRRVRVLHGRQNLVHPQEFGLEWSHRGNPWSKPIRYSSSELVDLTTKAWRLPIDVIAPNGQFIRGYFQTSELLPTIEKGIIPPLRSRFKDKVEHEFVGVHIRLNDYLKPKSADFHGVTDPVWSLEQGLQLREELNIRNIVVFSDSSNLASRICEPLKARDVQFDDSKSGWEVLAKMATSRALVMSNSSLSWWAGCLISDRDKTAKVIIPTPWLRNQSELDEKLLLPFWHQRPRRLYDV